MNNPIRKLNLFIKRIADVVISLIGIVSLFVLPVFELIYLLIRLTSKGPAVFKQIRIGKNKKPFTMYKFRTMIVEQFDKNGEEIMSEDRITPVGKILRKTSLDELPQLFNILNGTMSLVGPRPMLDYQAAQCDEEESRRFLMRPGITGLAQAKGRNNISWPERIKYDIEYISNFNIFQDIRILFRTAVSVLKHEGTDVVVDYRGVDKFSKHYKAPDDE